MNPMMAMALSGGGAVPATDVETVFHINARAGTGASATITNGINLSANGGLVIMKGRSGATDWAWYDTVRGATKDFASNNNVAAQTTEMTGLQAFNTTGFTIGQLPKINTSSATYVDYTFRESAKFLDIVTYAGTGSSATINHSLGSVPGLIIIKGLTGVGASGAVHSRALAVNRYLFLSGTSAGGTSANLYSSMPTSTSFSIGVDNSVNNATETYIAYVFGHDTGSNGIIFSDTFTVDGSGNASVTLGWEPQFLMVKASSTSGDWIVIDNLRGWTTATGDANVKFNTAGAEAATEYGEPTATGFNFKGGTASASYIYLAVRRPNTAPTSGTQVFNAATRTGTGANAVSTAAGFASDLIITKKRSSTTLTGARFVDRLRGKTIHLDSSSGAAEVTTADTITALDNNTGMSIGADATTSAFNTNTHTYVDLFFKRAKGVFDMVSDGGTGSAHTITHNLGAIPELIIRKGRSGATQWEVYCSALANTEKLVLNTTAAKATDTTAWNSTTPTASVFTVGTGANVNTNTATYVSYLFATLAGVSKVGSYTGNGTTQNIACGFSAGARFVMIKRTDATGDWFVWDTVRGIIAGNDPHISLNTTAAEVTTDDSIDPLSSGFTVNQLSATNINVNAAAYIFVAIS